MLAWCCSMTGMEMADGPGWTLRRAARAEPVFLLATEVEVRAGWELG